MSRCGGTATISATYHLRMHGQPVCTGSMRHANGVVHLDGAECLHRSHRKEIKKIRLGGFLLMVPRARILTSLCSHENLRVFVNFPHHVKPHGFTLPWFDPDLINFRTKHPAFTGCFVLVPRARIELATQGFSVLRSTTELPRRAKNCVGTIPKVDVSGKEACPDIKPATVRRVAGMSVCSWFTQSARRRRHRLHTGVSACVLFVPVVCVVPPLRVRRVRSGARSRSRRRRSMRCPDR